ncbi:hypothetical protein ILUMI_10820 [Ignelater luminosus]|uniref:AB hydrolase-1 domain-containing protein n=1 Tax=Ignelater luminosus TaxID=2038154 RepID=A0A8K0GDU0_IGNLU|nr:hypothetical protein ILUMI_10820 [Ignelater luminosus]
MDIEELKIPVPWGHVAAKAWGNEKNIPVLMIHGMADNAGSFDQLVPYLPTKFYYICIDLPGHGKSSHFPQYLPLHPLNIILTYKFIVNHLKRDKYIVIGHSWGGRTAIFFTQLYPEHVLKLVLLDAVYLQALSVDGFSQYTVGQFDQITEINDIILNSSRPTYSYDKAVEKIQQGRAYGQTLNKEAAEALFKRSSVAADNGQFYFSNDIRIKTFAVNLLYDKRFANNLIKALPITCPILFIIASESTVRLKRYKSIIDGLKKNNTKCFVKKVKGDHDVHIKQPEVVAKLICNFLDNQSKL